MTRRMEVRRSRGKGRGRERRGSGMLASRSWRDVEVEGDLVGVLVVVMGWKLVAGASVKGSADELWLGLSGVRRDLCRMAAFSLRRRRDFCWLAGVPGWEVEVRRVLLLFVERREKRVVSRRGGVVAAR